MRYNQTVSFSSVAPTIREEAERLARKLGVHSSGDRYDRPDECVSVYCLYVETVLRLPAPPPDAAWDGLMSFVKFQNQGVATKAVAWC